MKKIFWGLVGIGLGAVVGARAVQSVNRTKQKYAPQNVARQAGSKLEGLVARVKGAVADGREEMSRAEDELRADLGIRDAERNSI